MAIGQEEAGGFGSSGIMQRSIRAWQQKRIADAQEESNRQKEMQAKAQQEQKKQAGGGEKKKQDLLTPSSEIGKSIMSRSGAVFPVEQRVGAGVGGSTGRVTHFDPTKAPPYLDAIADKYGINRDDFKRMAWIESRFDPNARAGTSSAGGLFQFLDNSAKAYGLSNKFDGPANAEAAARMWNDNKAALSRALGREPTGGELYLAHQQGPGGAIKLLTNPTASATAIVGGDAVRLNGGNGGMSAGQFASLWTNKFSSLQAQNGRGDGATPRNQDAGNRASPYRVASNTTTATDAMPAPQASVSATTPGAGATPTTAQSSTPTTPTAAPPAPAPPMPPSRPADLGQPATPLPPRRPDDLGAQPSAPSAPSAQNDAGKGIGGFFDNLFGNGEPIRDQYGRTWDGFEGWVDPKAKAETATTAAKDEERGILDGLFGGNAANAGPDLFSGESGIFANLAKLFG